MIRKLASNAKWLFFANLFFAICQWGQLSLVARLGDGYFLGTYTISLAVITPIFAFFSFQLRTIQVTDTEKKWEIDDFLLFRTISYFIGLIVIIVVGYIFFDSIDEVLILLLMAVLKILEGYSEVFNSRHQLDEKMKVVFISFLLKGSLSFLSFSVTLFMYGNLLISLFSSCIAVLIVVIFFDYQYVSYCVKEHKYSIKKIIELLKVGTPLAFVMLIIALNSNMTKYITESLLGRDLQGVYSTLTYFFMAGIILIGALGQGFYPRLSRLYSENSVQFVKVSGSLVFLCFIVGLIGYAISFFGGEWILKLMFGANIASYHELFSRLMMSGIFLYIASAFGYILSSMRKFKIQPYLVAIILIIGLPLTYFKVLNYGMGGIPSLLNILYIFQSVLYLGAIVFYFLKEDSRFFLKKT